MLIPFGVFSAAGITATGPSYDLISTTVLGSATATVTFDVTGLGSTYKHLQVRAVTRTNHGDLYDAAYMRFNGSTSTYSDHQLAGTGSSIFSQGATSGSYINAFFTAGNTGTSGSFGAAVIDYLDAFSTTKNKTIRQFSGRTTGTLVTLGSGQWMSTSAITSISFTPIYGTTWNIGTRFSIYGVK